jgi:hypothetical protein
LILDIDEAGKQLTVKQKRLLLTHDDIPMSVGVIFFLLIFSGGLATLPFTLWKKGANLTHLEAIGCFGAATFETRGFNTRGNTLFSI